ILARQLLENKTAKHDILRRFVQGVGRDDVIFRIAMFKRDFQLHRLAFTLNLKWNDVAGVGMRADEIRELDLAVERIDIVSVLIDLVIANGGDNVADLHPGFRRGHIRLDAGDINAARFAGLAGKLSQLRISRWEK